MASKSELLLDLLGTNNVFLLTDPVGGGSSRFPSGLQHPGTSVEMLWNTCPVESLARAGGGKAQPVGQRSGQNAAVQQIPLMFEVWRRVGQSSPQVERHASLISRSSCSSPSTYISAVPHPELKLPSMLLFIVSDFSCIFIVHFLIFLFLF